MQTSQKIYRNKGKKILNKKNIPISYHGFMFFLFATPITCKSPKVSDMSHISSIPTIKCAINSPNLFPVLQKIPVFLYIIWAIKESTCICRWYCCGRFILVRSTVVFCAFCVVAFMMLEAAPWERINLKSCLETEYCLSLSLRLKI